MCIPTIKKTGEGCTGINSQFLLEKYGPEIIYIKGTYNIIANTIIRLEYDKDSYTLTIHIHVRNMTLAKLFDGYVSNKTNSEAFQMNGVYVPIGTCTFVNHLESVCANYSTISDTSHDDHERSTITAVNDNQVKKHNKYLFAEINKKDDDEIYLVTVSEIADSQRRHRLYKNHF